MCIEPKIKVVYCLESVIRLRLNESIICHEHALNHRNIFTYKITRIKFLAIRVSLTKNTKIQADNKINYGTLKQIRFIMIDCFFVGFQTL